MIKEWSLISPDGKVNNDKITFSSSYYCWNFLPKQIIMEELQPTKQESVTRDRDTSYKTVIMNISNENTMQLRPHQNEALAKMRLRRKGQVIVPTGGGKTMCMIEDAKR